MKIPIFRFTFFHSYLPQPPIGGWKYAAVGTP